jgi:chemotaxis protein CheX
MELPLSEESLVKAVESATAEVFEMMLNLQVTAGPAYTEQPGSTPTDGVIALLGLAGQWMGAGILQCDAVFARTIYQHMLGVETPAAEDAVDGEVLDAVAEIANMVIGNVKNFLEEALGPMGMSVPTVVFGRNFTTRAGGANNWTVIPFECSGSRLLVKLYLRHTPGNTEIRRGFSLHKDFAI